MSATGSFIASSGLRFLCPPQAKKSWVRAPYREEAFSCPVFAFCLEPHIRNFRRPSPFFAPRSRARRRSTHVVVSRSPCDGSTLGLFLAGIFVVSLPGTRLAPVPPTLLSWGRSPRTRAGPRPWKFVCFPGFPASFLPRFVVCFPPSVVPAAVSLPAAPFTFSVSHFPYLTYFLLRHVLHA